MRGNVPAALTRTRPSAAPPFPQVGTELFSTLAREADASSASTRDEIHEAFFRTPQARRRGSGSGRIRERGSRKCRQRRARRAAVLIDMEPKVVQALLRRAKRSGRWRYDSARTLAFQSGSGNNWARGYNTYGPQTRETALELVRRETEACDHSRRVLTAAEHGRGHGRGPRRVRRRGASGRLRARRAVKPLRLAARERGGDRAVVQHAAHGERASGRERRRRRGAERPAAFDVRRSWASSALRSTT